MDREELDPVQTEERSPSQPLHPLTSKGKRGTKLGVWGGLDKMGCRRAEFRVEGTNRQQNDEGRRGGGGGGRGERESREGMKGSLTK